MEEKKKLKTIPIEVFGYEAWIEPKDDDEEEYYDSLSRYTEDGMIFTVGDERYTPSDFANADDFLTPEQQKKYKEVDVAKFFAESGAEEGWLYLNKAWTTINIEIPEDEEFDPAKAALVLRNFIYPEDPDEATVCDFFYDGKAYGCYPEDSDGVSGNQIWLREDYEEEEEEEED